MVIKIIDILTYLLLLGLGIYFIHHGAVFERFLKKRTQYAEYLEDVTELPTILTYVMFKEKPLEYGSHYNISLMIDSTKSEGTNLTSGINTVFNSSLRVSFEEQKEFSGNIGDAQEKRRYFKITPLNFQLANLQIKYIFEASHDYNNSISLIGFALTTLNNSYCGVEVRDGEEQNAFTKLGHYNLILLKPQKHIYLKDHETCRETPFNALLYKDILKTVKEICDAPCRIPNYWMCSYFETVAGLPICKNTDEKQCYINALNYAKKNIPLKPCTSLGYEGKNTLWPHSKKNEAMVKVIFESPPKVKVKEEFLIFDMVAMISAIGGTMGLCVGFSFREIFGYLYQWIEFCLKGFKDRNSIAAGSTDEHKTQTTTDGYFVKDDMKHQLTTHEERLSAVEEKIKMLCLNLKDAVSL